MAEIEVARSNRARGSRRWFFTKVNMSPDANHIFSQPQKTPQNARIPEPARVDAPGRAISKAERRAAPARLREALVRRETLACKFGFEASGTSRDLARQANSTLI